MSKRTSAATLDGYQPRYLVSDDDDASVSESDDDYSEASDKPRPKKGAAAAAAAGAKKPKKGGAGAATVAAMNAKRGSMANRPVGVPEHVMARIVALVAAQTAASRRPRPLLADLDLPNVKKEVLEMNSDTVRSEIERLFLSVAESILAGTGTPWMACLQ